MAYLNLFRDQLLHNYQFLDELFKENEIKWGITTKLLCGTKSYLEEVINLGIKEVHDSRISNLQRIKEIDPETMTVYIKPPPKDTIPDIVVMRMPA
jgi:ornithine racemase